MNLSQVRNLRHLQLVPLFLAIILPIGSQGLAASSTTACKADDRVEVSGVIAFYNWPPGSEFGIFFADDSKPVSKTCDVHDIITPKIVSDRCKKGARFTATGKPIRGFETRLVADSLDCEVAVANEVSAQESACKDDPRLTQLMACSTTYCRISLSDPAFKARLRTLDERFQGQQDAIGRLSITFSEWVSFCRLNGVPKTEGAAMDLLRVLVIQLNAATNIVDEAKESSEEADSYAPEIAKLRAALKDDACANQIADIAKEKVKLSEEAVEKTRPGGNTFDCIAAHNSGEAK